MRLTFSSTWRSFLFLTALAPLTFAACAPNSTGSTDVDEADDPARGEESVEEAKQARPITNVVPTASSRQ